MKRPPVHDCHRIVFSQSPQRRLRLLHWFIASLVYLGIALLLLSGVGQGWMSVGAVAGWSVFVGMGLLASYLALRSGWSERFADPALTMWQLSMGVIAVNWGYVICGPMRTSALFPLMVIFAFGAYSLCYRQIAYLTLFAVVSLVTAVTIRYAIPGWLPVTRAAEPLQVDINNLLMIVVVLPALALVAARLSALRSKLRAQRTALTEALDDVARLAVSDELTGLPNRRAMLETLARNVTHARRGIMPFCVAMMDLDHFKTVNDTLGHATGDAVLKALCRCDVARTARRRRAWALGRRRIPDGASWRHAARRAKRLGPNAGRRPRCGVFRMYGHIFGRHRRIWDAGVRRSAAFARRRRPVCRQECRP